MSPIARGRSGLSGGCFSVEERALISMGHVTRSLRGPWTVNENSKKEAAMVGRWSGLEH
jgi:hypothetical protein